LVGSCNLPEDSLQAEKKEEAYRKLEVLVFNLVNPGYCKKKKDE
jgi:hypothetical protein